MYTITIKLLTNINDIMYITKTQWHIVILLLGTCSNWFSPGILYHQMKDTALIVTIACSEVKKQERLFPLFNRCSTEITYLTLVHKVSMCLYRVQPVCISDLLFWLRTVALHFLLSDLAVLILFAHSERDMLILHQIHYNTI